MLLAFEIMNDLAEHPWMDLLRSKRMFARGDYRACGKQFSAMKVRPSNPTNGKAAKIFPQGQIEESNNPVQMRLRALMAGMPSSSLHGRIYGVEQKYLHIPRRTGD